MHRRMRWIVRVEARDKVDAVKRPWRHTEAIIEGKLNWGAVKIYSMDDEFNMEGAPSALYEQILVSLAQAGLRTSRTDAGIQARAGSDFLFRLLGTPLGSSQLPVGIDVRVIS